MAYVHLHRHSEFSRLDGIGTAKQYAERAAEQGQFALGQTDHGTMSGALHHIEACRQNKVMPIVGVEAYFRPQRSNKATRQAWHLCLFAKDLTGWHNLMRLVSISNSEIEDGGGFYQYPTVDFDLLKEYSDGIACSSACISSFLSQLITWGDSVSVTSYIDQMLDIYGDDFWIELMPHDFDDQRTLNTTLTGIASERSIPLLATNDAHFLNRDWAETHRIAKIMGSGKTLAKVAKDVECGKADYLSELTPSLYLAHEEEMFSWFQKHHPDLDQNVVDEAMENTVTFARKLVPFTLDRTPKLPSIPTLDKTPEETLWGWIEEGMGRLVNEYPEDHWQEWPIKLYDARVEYEWEILKDKGVIDYFVMLGDVVKWAESQGIRMGLGRGSAAGCLISYLVGITAVDPISYGLLFERFLNPERRGLPDIDMDFDSERREEVKAYLAETYGAGHVADIITHQRFQPKKVIGDLARVYGVPLPEVRKVLDSIEIRQDDEETTLEEIVLLNDDLAQFRDNYEEIWEHALRLEGMVANAGRHAAGIIITPKPIAEYMALERSKSGDLVTSWSDAADFSVISDYGFLKYDFLGITGLAKHEYACNLIEQRTGESPDLRHLDVCRSPYTADPEVLKIFTEGYTMGIFQFSSRGITSLVRDIDPDNTLDLAAANALYRPGPMKGGVTWDFPKRKHNIFLRQFWNDEVKPILSETHGLIAYQEQVMRLGTDLAGFSGAEADDMRKAMGKLYRIKGGGAAKAFMGQFEEKWFSGTASIGINREVAQEIWDKMLEFGHYGFNRSHSVCYSLTAYQDAYLKAKYPAEWYAALLTYEKDDEARMAILREAKVRHIEIVLPDVNTTEAGYTVDDEGRLVLGLAGIKGVGLNSAKEILRRRPFLTLDDLLTRHGSKIPLRPLIESGAADSLCDRRHLLTRVLKPLTDRKLAALHDAGEERPMYDVLDHLKHNTKLKKPREIPEPFEVPTDKFLDRLQADLLRLPLSLNLSDDQQSFIEQNAFTQEELDDAPDGTDVVVGGEITRVTRKKTKKGHPFANVMLVFGRNQWQLKFWADKLAYYDRLLEEGRIIMVRGKKDEWNGFVSVVADLVEDIEALNVQQEETDASTA